LPKKAADVLDSEWAIGLARQYGYTGLLLSLVANCMGVPLASEVTLPVAGVLVRLGVFDLTTVFVAAVVAQLIGMTIAYYVARRGGIELLEKYGKYVLLRRRHVRRLKKLFEKHDADLILFGTCLPGFHGYVGYPAGLAAMSYRKFIVMAGFGTIIWTAALMGVGYLLHDQLDAITGAAHGLGIAAALAVLLLAAIFAYIKVRRKR
jgi:membrane protein DedA with SNARE-associated domain